MLGEWEGLITNLEKHIKVSSALERLEKSSNKLRSPLHEQQTNTLLAKPGKENSEPAQSYKSCQQGEEDVHWVEKNISQSGDQERQDCSKSEKEKELSHDFNTSSSSQQTVACSICSVPIAPAHLEKHQERCASLQKSFTAPPPSKPPQNSRPQLPKLVYALLKDSELRKKCKEAGLNWKGDKTTLTKRHKRFSLLYNVEREAERPRSNAVLATQVHTYPPISIAFTLYYPVMPDVVQEVLTLVQCREGGREA